MGRRGRGSTECPQRSSERKRCCWRTSSSSQENKAEDQKWHEDIQFLGLLCLFLDGKCLSQLIHETNPCTRGRCGDPEPLQNIGDVQNILYMVPCWSYEIVSLRTESEHLHMSLSWSYNNVPYMTLGGRSILVILWSHCNITKMTSHCALFFCNGLMAPTGELAPPAVHLKVSDSW